MKTNVKVRCNKRANEIEQKCGSIVLMKIACSSIARLLVEKGVITEKEMCQSFLDEQGMPVWIKHMKENVI